MPKPFAIADNEIDQTTRLSGPASTEAGLAALRDALAFARSDALRPPPAMTVDEWADTYRQLSKAVSSTGGKWRTGRVEVARGAMRAVTEPGVTTISVMACTQLMKTSLIECAVGYFAHLDPAPLLVVQPKDEMVDAFSKERVSALFDSTPVLKELAGRAKTRDSDDTLRYKKFPGGSLSIVSAGSPTNLAMRSIRVTLCDEIDKYQPTKEGDPIELAEERAATFPTTRLHIRVCSPTIRGKSRIERSYNSSDMRRPYVACPHCAEWQSLSWQSVQWDKDAVGNAMPETARIYCNACGSAWEEHERLKSLQSIQWRQTRPFTCCGEKQEAEAWTWDGYVYRATCIHCGEMPVSNDHAGFWASKLYSPWDPVAKLAKKFLEVKADPEQLQTFINTQLAETFEESSEKMDPASLEARREVYTSEVPDGVLALTAGMDMQNDRIECEVVGWGAGEESWSVGYEIFHGDPTQPEIWERLDDYLQKRFFDRLGRPYAVQAAAFDSGGNHTQAVYSFCKARSGRRVWAVKGASERQGQRSPIWPKKPTLKTSNRTPLYLVGTNAAKDATAARLRISEPGPGYCHFPVERDKEYFDQLTAEKLVTRKDNSGGRARVWVCPDGRRNEALDCRVYAYAALQGLAALGHRLPRGGRADDAAEDASRPENPEPAARAEATTPPPPAQNATGAKRKKRRQIGKMRF